MSEEFIKMNCLLHLYRQIIPHVLIIMGQVREMPIVKQLVEKMGGTITVESKLGEGAVLV